MAAIPPEQKKSLGRVVLNKLFLVILYLILTVINIAFANENEAKSNYRLESDVLKFRDVLITFPVEMLDGYGTISDNNSTAIVDIDAKLALYTLAGEPVVYCIATWKFKSAKTTYNSVYSKGFNVSEYQTIPEDVEKKLSLYGVKLRIYTELYSVNYIDCSPGVMSNSGSQNTSFNVPSSPSWHDLFFNSGYPGNLDKEAAKAYYLSLVKSGIKITNNNRFEVISAEINLYPIGQWINQLNKEEAEKRYGESKAFKEQTDNDDVWAQFDQAYQASKIKDSKNDDTFYTKAHAEILNKIASSSPVNNCKGFKDSKNFDSMEIAINSFICLDNKKQGRKILTDANAWGLATAAIPKNESEKKSNSNKTKLTQTGSTTTKVSKVMVPNEQTTTKATGSLLMLIDTSGSMDGTRLTEAKKAAIELINKSTNNNTEVAVLAFSGDCSHPISNVHPFSINNTSLQQFINNLSASGGTPMSAAVEYANVYMTNNKSRQSASQMILLLADGDDNCGIMDPVITSLQTDGILFTHQAVGLELDAKSSAVQDLKNIAKISGGDYTSADNANQLSATFEHAAIAMGILEMIGRKNKTKESSK